MSEECHQGCDSPCVQHEIQPRRIAALEARVKELEENHEWMMADRDNWRIESQRHESKLAAEKEKVANLSIWLRDQGELSTGKAAEFMGIGIADLIDVDHLRAKLAAVTEERDRERHMKEC